MHGGRAFVSEWEAKGRKLFVDVGAEKIVHWVERLLLPFSVILFPIAVT